jgi:protein-disulfide isomerase
MKLTDVALAGCLAVITAAGFAACASDPSAATQLPAPASDPDQVVAEVGGRKVTLKELDAKWEEFDAAERARVTQLLYQNRRNMLEQLVGDILIENAAKAANQSVEQYLAQDAARRQQPVTEAEIAQFYEQNKDRAQGRTLDDLRGQIKEFLESQRKLQVRAQLIEELKSARGADVKVLLDPPRYNVAVLDHDPIRGEATAPVTLVEFSDYQ